jgi:hypothetical protein
MSTLTHENFFPVLQAALPEFTAFSSDAQQHQVSPEGYLVYGLFLDYAHMLQCLLDADNRPDLARYFAFLNQLLESSDEYLQHCLYECVIEFLALSRASYYHTALQYLSPAGISLLNYCKAVPPLGVLSPPW